MGRPAGRWGGVATRAPNVEKLSHLSVTDRCESLVKIRTSSSPGLEGGSGGSATRGDGNGEGMWRATEARTASHDMLVASDQ